MGTELGSHTSSLTSLVLSPFSGIPVHLHTISMADYFPDSCHCHKLPILPSRSELFLLPVLLEINMQGEVRQSF